MRILTLHLDETGAVVAIRAQNAAGVAQALPPETELAEILDEISAGALFSLEQAKGRVSELETLIDQAASRVAELEAQLETTGAALAQSSANDSDQLREAIRQELAAQGLQARPSFWSRLFGG